MFCFHANFFRVFAKLPIVDICFCRPTLPEPSRFDMDAGFNVHRHSADWCKSRSSAMAWPTRSKRVSPPIAVEAYRAKLCLDGRLTPDSPTRELKGTKQLSRKGEIAVASNLYGSLKGRWQSFKYNFR